LEARPPVTSDWEPPAGHVRAAGGLLAAVAGESWHPDGFRAGGPVAAALLELASGYVSRNGGATPIEVAQRQDGVPAPAWLLPVAIVRPFSNLLAADALQLARASGVPGHALSPCVTYVELAAELFAGRPATEAVEAITGEPVPRKAPTPALCGEPHLDALSTAVWALAQPEGVTELIPALVPITPPSVRAAAAALVGLRDGSNALPGHWHRDVPDAAACHTLAADLVGVRHHAYLHPTPRTASGEHPVAAAAPPAPPDGDETHRASFWSWSLRR
jgi:hypothetical protein